MMPLLGADRFILGGGGLLQESTGPWNPAYYLSLMVVAKLLGCYTEVKAIGVDPLRRPANRFWTRFVLNHWADLVSVRDEPSRQALVAAGVHPAIGLEPDPVFELRAPQNLPQGKGIALALSPSPAHPQWGREVSRLCDRLAENGCSPIDLLVFFPEQDAEFCRTVASFSYAVRHVRLWQNPQDLVSWITEYQMVIGTRFHALVLAAANQIPFVGWGTQKKVISLCQACGKPSWNPDEEAWFLARQMKQILALYQSRSKSVILAGTD
jgi:polysaccharide pyruvyl transferase CsaB